MGEERSAVSAYSFVWVLALRTRDATGRPPLGSRNRCSLVYWFTGLQVDWLIWFTNEQEYWFTGLLVYWYTDLLGRKYFTHFLRACRWKETNTPVNL